MIRNLGFILLALVFAAVPACAKTKGGSLQVMDYEVYASGIHVVQAHLKVDLRESGRYALALDAATQGFLAALAPWEGTFESRGWILGKDDFRPEMHRSADLWRGEGEVKDYRYGRDRTFKGLSVTKKGGQPEPAKAPPKLTEGTTDALTAALIVMQAVAEGKECEGSSEVFDGSRRYRLVFKSEGFVDLAASRYNIYHGRAAQCTAEVVPLAGAWHKKPRGWMSIQEQGRERGTMPTVWLAKINEGGPAIPVRIQVKTAYGTLFMHLTGYNSGE